MKYLGLLACLLVLPASVASAASWSTYVGGTQDDRAWGLAADGAGDLYITGSTYSTGWVSRGYDTLLNLDQTADLRLNANNPDLPDLVLNQSDAFLVKISSSGEHVWSTFLGGEAGEGARGVAVDANNNVYVSGSTSSGGWITGGFDTSAGDRTDAFVVKLNSSGRYQWGTYLGGDLYEYGIGIAIDHAGNVIATGYTESPGWVRDGFDTIHNGDRDIHIVKMTNTGRHVWSTYAGGAQMDGGMSIVVDTADNIFVSGLTESEGWARGGHDDTYNGRLDAFLMKLTGDGRHVWSTYVGSPENEDGDALAIDAAGNILLGGTTHSVAWNSNPPWETHEEPKSDGYLMKFSPEGRPLMFTLVGGPDNDGVRGIVTNAKREIFLTGFTESANWNDISLGEPYQGLTDGFLMHLSERAVPLRQTFFGGSAHEWGQSLVLTPEGDLVIGGTTNSTDWIRGGYDTEFGGKFDGFVAKIELTDPLPAAAKPLAIRSAK